MCQYEGDMSTWLSNSKGARFVATMLMLFYILPGLFFIIYWWGAYRCPKCGAIGDNQQVPHKGPNEQSEECIPTQEKTTMGGLLLRLVGSLH